MAGITSFYFYVEKEEWKLDTLCDLLETLPAAQVVLFVNTRDKVDWLAEKMRGRDHAVAATHGDMDQDARDTVMAEFIAGSPGVLVATDDLFAPAGLHVHQVPLVVNYDVPTQPDNFLHRIGRSGPFWTTGLATTFVNREDERMFVEIQRFHNIFIEELPANAAALLP